MKRKLSITLSVSCILLALLAMSYPLISNALERRYHSEVETAYHAAVEQTDHTTLEQKRQAAQAYNAMLCSGFISGAPEDYEQLLDVAGDGVMSYIEIPKLDIYLPIAHGTSAETLEHFVGHVLGSSLPVGGKGTHAVLSGHSGLASSKIFSDITELQKGDVFYLHTLGETLAYEVDQIATVLPGDSSRLAIEPEADYVTLVTCTPFGINTHRLLVRGHRVPSAKLLAPMQATSHEATASTWERQYVTSIVISLSAAAVIALGFYFVKRRQS